ncbi:unnamed protein product, partial [Rotaria sp. Silwood2]
YMEMLSARYSNRELYWINQYRLIRQNIFGQIIVHGIYVYWCDCGPHVRISCSFLNGENVTYRCYNRNYSTRINNH